MVDEVSKRMQFVTEDPISVRGSSMCKSKRHEISEACRQTANSIQLCYPNTVATEHVKCS